MMKWKLIIVYKDRNLKNDEVEFEDKAKAEYFKEYCLWNDSNLHHNHLTVRRSNEDVLMKRL